MTSYSVSDSYLYKVHRELYIAAAAPCYFICFSLNRKTKHDIIWLQFLLLYFLWNGKCIECGFVYRIYSFFVWSILLSFSCSKSLFLQNMNPVALEYTGDLLWKWCSSGKLNTCFWSKRLFSAQIKISYFFCFNRKIY